VVTLALHFFFWHCRQAATTIALFFDCSSCPVFPSRRGAGAMRRAETMFGDEADIYGKGLMGKW